MTTALALLLLVPAAETQVRPKVGEEAPAFSLPASTGKTVSLADFKGKKKVVLAFYPKAFTGGCTKEMSGLRDHKKMFDDSSAQIIGVSLDSLDTQTRFAESLKLPFPLLADTQGKVATAYGVKGLLWANRTTFVIDESGKITAVFEGKDAIEPAGIVAACRSKTS
jgi:peroxiredoxin Q/BCP